MDQIISEIDTNCEIASNVYTTVSNAQWKEEDWRQILGHKEGKMEALERGLAL